MSAAIAAGGKSMKEQNLETVQKFWRSINSRDVEGYLSTFAEGGVAYDPVSSPALETVQARREFMQGLLDSFSEISAEINFMTACGPDQSAAKWTVVGKSQDGDPIRLEGIDTYLHSEDGLILEMRGYFET